MVCKLTPQARLWRVRVKIRHLEKCLDLKGEAVTVVGMWNDAVPVMLTSEWCFPKLFSRLCGGGRLALGYTWIAPIRAAFGLRQQELEVPETFLSGSLGRLSCDAWLPDGIDAALAAPSPFEWPIERASAG